MSVNELSAEELTPQQTADLLRRIDAAVEKDQQKHGMEITCAIILSLATLGSAWCAYQATLWGGVQAFRMGAAGTAGREASESTLLRLQGRAFDASMFIQYREARSVGNKKLEAFLYQHFRPEMKKAVDAWLATDPFTNPKAPPDPFRMPDYVQQEEEEMKRQESLAGQMSAEAYEANQTVGRYVLCTVLFASVLFFVGMGNRLDSYLLRRILGFIALTLFVATVIGVMTLPLCRK